jgi:hypothetical protein
MKRLSSSAAGLVGLAMMLSVPLHAQMGATDPATAAITPDVIYQHLTVIADDSMMGRDTPSPGLDMTAQYVADQFASLGLQPGGENGGWFQRYPIYRTQLDIEQSHVGFMMEGAHLHASFATDAARWFGDIPAEAVRGQTVVIGGALDAELIAEMDLEGKIALVIIDFANLSEDGQQQGLFAIYESGPAAIVAVSNRTEQAFESRIKRQSRPRTTLELSEGGIPAVEVHERALTDVLAAASLDIEKIREADGFITQDLPALTIDVEMDQKLLSEETAPNTIGILEGSDPELKSEYVVYSAHMDHIGIRSGAADSISNGADDDASGTVGVLMLAAAYAQAETRPKRSIMFITVSGEEKGLWGSAYFADHPTVPVSDMVANINIDMIGRNWPDTIVAIGKEHSDLGETLNRVNGDHPELGMTAIDDVWPEERFYFRSDHFNFASKGVPVLFFFNGVHDDYHQVSDEIDKIDTEKMSRILQLLYYLGSDVANNPERPQWNPDSYLEIVEGA